MLAPPETYGHGTRPRSIVRDRGETSKKGDDDFLRNILSNLAGYPRKGEVTKNRRVDGRRTLLDRRSM
jgi:hypothetical protein